MNTEGVTNPGSAAFPGTRRTIATYSRYEDAQRAVDYLSDQKFPVEHTAIVAEGLRLVEQVTGRLTYGRAALSGALNGAFVGVFAGFLFGMFAWISPLVSGLALALYGLLYGAVVGALLGMLFHAFTGGRRDFTSLPGIAADRYDLAVDETFASEAASLLANMTSPPRPQTPSPGREQPQPA